MLIAECIRNLFLRSSFHNIWFLNGLSIVSRITDLAYKTFPYMALMYYSSANTSPLPLYPHYHCHSVILWYGMNIASYWLLFNYSILAHASVMLEILSHLPEMTSPSSLHSQCLLLKMVQALFILFTCLLKSVLTITNEPGVIYTLDDPYSHAAYTWRRYL